MKNITAISILKTFSNNEIKLFEEFLNSPFHNKNLVVIKFFNLLKQFYPGYSDDNLTKESLFRQMYGNEKYKESYIRNLFSDLNILEEKFLIVNNLNREFVSDRILIEELGKRDLLELVAKKIKKFEKKNNSNKSRDHYYYFNKDFIYEITSLLSIDKSLFDDFRKDQLISKIKHFILSVIESSFQFLIEEQRIKIKHSYNFVRQIIEYMNKHFSDFNDSPLLLIYYFLWQSFFETNNEKHFSEAKTLFKKHFNVLEKIDKKNIYSIMQTYYILQIEKGKKQYERELLLFLMDMLKNNVLSHKERDVIDLNLYRNILIMCYRNKEIDILNKFIPFYIHYVNPTSRSSVRAYSYAHLNCLQKDFEKALTLCNEINFNDLFQSTNENLFFKIDIKNLMLICLYELNSFENALPYIDSYRHFLNNSKLIREKLKTKYLNFLQMLNRLIQLNLKFDDYKYTLFIKKLHNTPDIISKVWLLEKSKELELRKVKS